MITYEQQVVKELASWKRKMNRKPSIVDRASKRLQAKLNSYIPEKIHTALTTAIRQMVRAVLFGATYATPNLRLTGDLQLRESLVQDRISSYRKAAAAEGGITGAGGILLGLADFPLLLGIKMKLLFDVASLYGYDIKDYRERLFMLYAFQLAFSSQQHRREVFSTVNNWSSFIHTVPENIESFNWRSFQQEYRDYIDIAKMLQLVPGIGAVVGIIANYKLIDHLGNTSMNAYRLRWQQQQLLQH